MDPRSLKPKKNWAVILDDKRTTKLASGLVIPETESGVEKVSEWTGTVIRLGSSDKTLTLDLVEGQRILYRGFLKYANSLDTDEVWEDGSKKKYFLMDIEDIMAVLPDDVSVGFLSRKKE